jgi:hypothetical protein
MLPVLPRIPDVTDLIEDEFYFILHAPRQSGKSTYLDFLTDKINNDGNYYAISCDLSPLRPVVDEELAISRLASQIDVALASSELEIIQKLAYSYKSLPAMEDSGSKVRMMLNAICRDLDKDLIVFFDEADCLSGSALITFLTQIRAGYLKRHKFEVNKFPKSMALVGMRDIRDYLVQVRPGEESIGLASPFNVKKESLTLANFTRDEIQALYNQHTEATGQIFKNEALDRAWYWTEGQPWLVNALAYEVVVKQLKNDYAKVITESHIDQAAEILIQHRDTHIDSLLERLKEPKVRRVLDPIIAGDEYWNDEVTEDDIKYVGDLGLIKQDDDAAMPANPIYGDVIIRALTQRLQTKVPKELVNRWMDGSKLDMTALLKHFQQFWRENSEMLGVPYSYKESTPHLVCFAFLQRILNGAAEALSREYALGRRRLDIEAKYKGVSYPVEFKVKHKGQYSDNKTQQALKQLSSYMDKLGAEEGWLVEFDKEAGKTWDEKITWETKQVGNLTIHVVGC